ncbi:MAG: hypothetical protein O7A06_07425 [Acidobacteria bacterium]|nr:hypothetical protein [Acidobacteriota bacterium]
MRQAAIFICRGMGMASASRAKESLALRRLIVFLWMAPLILSSCSSPGPEVTSLELSSLELSPPEVASPGPGRQVIDRMIAAHGGMEKWRSAPTVSFEVTVQPPGSVAHVTVEQGARRAYHDYPETGARMSWDGTQAWSENWQYPVPPRFYALVNFYFLNLPWVAADPGVILSEPGTGRLWDDPTEYITVKMAFEPGVGDTPDDDYVLYIDPASYLLKAAEYTVTGRPESNPPGILVYEEFTTVDGLTVPAKASVYGKQDRTFQRTRMARNWSFREPFDESRMVMPPGAVVDTFEFAGPEP